jgi:hypothetical protein
MLPLGQATIGIRSWQPVPRRKILDLLYACYVGTVAGLGDHRAQFSKHTATLEERYVALVRRSRASILPLG